MLAMQDDVPVTPPVRSARVHGNGNGNGTAKFDLWLGLTPGPGESLCLELEYASSLLPQDQAVAFMSRLRGVVERALTESRSPLGRFLSPV